MRLARVAFAFALLAAFAADARDRGADGRWSARRSSHFELYQDVAIERYSGRDGSRAFEIALLAALESAHDRVRSALGIEPRTRVRVFVYDPEVFERSFAARFGFRAAGFWDGAIQVRGGTRVDAALVSTLTHEYVHAALTSLAPVEVWPGWLNEGLAEYFERAALGRDRLSTSERAELQAAIGSGRWLPLAALGGPSFSAFDPSSARLAYLESFASVSFLVRSFGEPRLERLVEELAKTRMLERALERALRVDLATLEARVVSDLH